MSVLRNRLITRAVTTFGLDSDDEYRKAAAFVDHAVDNLEADLEAERFEVSHLREERDNLLNYATRLERRLADFDGYADDWTDEYRDRCRVAHLFAQESDE